jgi:hypothetical protein
MEFAYAIVQPYTDKPDRLETAIVVRTFATAAEAFAELSNMVGKLRGFGLADDTIEMLVVDRNRRPVARGR